MMFFGLFWLIVLVTLVRLMLPQDDGRRLPPGEAQRLEDEVRRLRDEMDRLNGQVDRLLDEQSFLLRLLETGERRRLPDAPPEGTEGEGDR